MRALASVGLALSFSCGQGAPPQRDLAKKLLAARAAGLTQAQKDGIYDHCSYDVGRFCPSIRRTDKSYFRKAAACLHDHAQDITDDCSNAFQAICGESGDDCDFDHAVEGPGYGRDRCKPSQNEWDHKCYEPCARGLVFYQGKCINFKTDPDNCGEIGNQCDVPGGDPCVDGECVAACPDSGPTTDCAGSCTDASSDPQNCGACGVACKPAESCAQGKCTPPPCDPNRCEPPANAIAVCVGNGCGFECKRGFVKNPAGDGCVAVCPAGDLRCGNACVNPTNDPANCGACGKACAAGDICVSGQCTRPSCPAGDLRCGNACVNPTNDPANCGACGKACAAGDTCVGGQCTPPSCPAGDLRCGNACVNPTNDPANCGGCGRACAAGDTCVGGQCTPPSCPPGDLRCGNACVNPTSDASNCGGCGLACRVGQSCISAICTNAACDPGRIRCGDNCVDPDSDRNNCGACGHRCSGAQVCGGGVCCAPGLCL